MRICAERPGGMYDSEYQAYYYEVAQNSTTWAHPEDDVCGCHGSGWWSSQVDTWHKCPYHKPDAPHPECDYYDLDDNGEPVALEPLPPEPAPPVDDDIPF